jgi:hypothetical protein
MFAHLAFDTRCPLCRAAIWWAWRHGRNPGHGPRAQSSELAGQGRSWTHVHGSACSLRDGSRGSRQPRARSERRGRIIGPPDGPHVRVAARRAERDADHPRPIGPRTQSAVISHGLHACASSATTQHLSARWNRRPGEGNNTFHTVMTHWWVSEDAVGRCLKACATISGDSALRLSSPGAKINVCKTT